jgi:hypothetical protein
MAGDLQHRGFAVSGDRQQVRSEAGRETLAIRDQAPAIEPGAEDIFRRVYGL